ncbi:hypothetical protein [Campylobacter suis]|uniref:RecT family protein n=1 Tax=Campylobacter suis TaxID=2790657 RepID=A0ABM8Q628_9BACT|nr:hypothetical protein [Campylobacter suis]CAD7288268.1 hypothetical protein LMG8286_01236 [Campylobacter suis]
MNQLTTIEQEKERFELEQRKAKAFVSTAFFPQHLKGSPDVSVANAIIVYDIASRMNLSPLEVAQSIFIIHGKPSFETKFLVARLNSSGLLKGRLQTIVSENGQSAYCEAIDAQTGQTLRGTTITMQMAQAEGWLGKNGSKWKTMPTLMLKYRAQSFFINEFFPEVRLGLRTKEEVQDIEADYSEVQTPVYTSDKKPLDLNEIASLGLKKASELKAQKSEPIEAEIAEVPVINVDEPLPHDELQSKLMRRGLNENEAERVVMRFNVEQVQAFLNDPSSIDTLVEQNAD